MIPLARRVCESLFSNPTIFPGRAISILSTMSIFLYFMTTFNIRTQTGATGTDWWPSKVLSGYQYRLGTTWNAWYAVKRDHRSEMKQSIERLSNKLQKKRPLKEQSHCWLSVWEFDNNLAEYNQRATKHISELLGISTQFTDSRLLSTDGGKTERLIGILQKVGATTYISGPSAKSYIDEPTFAEAGIELVYKEYPDYPAYPQCCSPFSPFVTVLDLLFNVGRKAPHYIWGWREPA